MIRDHSDAAGWRASTHALGRGRFRPDLVRSGDVDGSGDVGLSLALDARTCDGAELRSPHAFDNGMFSATLRLPRAPGSLSAFFLYETDAAHADEIDMEMLNDGSRRVLLTVWVGGVEVDSVTRVLPFNPHDAAHRYTIERGAGRIAFRAEDLLLHDWHGTQPTARLDVRVSAWWPNWLQPAPLTDGQPALQLRRVLLPDVA